MQLAGFARRAAAVDVEAACIPGVGLRGGDHLGQIHAFQAREGPRRSECGFDIGCGRDDAAVLRTLLAQDARQAAGVDLGDADDAVLVQVVRQRHRGAPLVAVSGGAAHDQPGGMHGGRFDVVVVAAGVADVRIGQGDDLAAIARVGQDFLIPRHRGVEHHLADRAANRADTLAVEDGSIGERKKGGRECTHEKLLESAWEVMRARERRARYVQKAGRASGPIPLRKPFNCIFPADSRQIARAPSLTCRRPFLPAEPRRAARSRAPQGPPGWSARADRPPRPAPPDGARHPPHAAPRTPRPSP
ncbi:MAG: hypothetical protein BWZ09_00132 [Alphaproteobacteria bacterium ADurb.BinA305]|nr:MAG: hypothetical protein BWZ09_00132 [Alphaproteobacteria bacterium ADurb.BinA305]